MEFKEVQAGGLVPSNVTANNYKNTDNGAFNIRRDFSYQKNWMTFAIIDSIMNKQSYSESNNEGNGIKILIFLKAIIALLFIIFYLGMKILLHFILY